MSHLEMPLPLMLQVARLKQALQDSQAERESVLLDKEVLLQRLHNLEQEIETKKRSQDDRSRHVKTLEVGSAAQRPKTTHPVPAVLCANSKGQSSPSHPPSHSCWERGVTQPGSAAGGVLLVLLIFTNCQHSWLCFGSVRHCPVAWLAAGCCFADYCPSMGWWVRGGLHSIKLLCLISRHLPFPASRAVSEPLGLVGFCWVGSTVGANSLPPASQLTNLG